MRILIVEDNDHTRLELLKSLSKEGFYVEAVDNGAAALKIVKNSKFDFVLSDINMPGIGGLELAEKLLGDPPMMLYTSGRNVVGLMDLAKEFKVSIFMTNATLEGIKNAAMEMFSKSVDRNTQVANSI